MPFFFKTTPVEVYRRQTPASNTEDPEYTLVATIDLNVQPFTGDEAMWAGQQFSNIRYLAIAYDITTDIREEDELYYKDWDEYSRVQFVMKYRQGVLPHIEYFTTDTQWRRNV